MARLGFCRGGFPFIYKNISIVFVPGAIDPANAVGWRQQGPRQQRPLYRCKGSGKSASRAGQNGQAPHSMCNAGRERPAIPTDGANRAECPPADGFPGPPLTAQTLLYKATNLFSLGAGQSRKTVLQWAQRIARPAAWTARRTLPALKNRKGKEITCERHHP